MTELSKKPSYRADIQGLRGIAVLLVVFFHSGLPLPGGFVGVDVFFVISGYVITNGIVARLEDGTFSFRDFYARRARRLLPALAVMLGVVLALATWLAPLVAQRAVVRTGLAASIFNANHYLLIGDGYFASSVEYNALLHTWSLSVEEQFYFAFPLLLWGLWRLGKAECARERVVWGIAVASGLSFAASLWLSYTSSVFGISGPSLAFYTVVARAWQFGIGALLVLKVERIPVGTLSLRVSGILGVIMVMASGSFFNDTTVFPGIAVVVPTLGAALVIFAGVRSDNQGIVTRILSAKPLVRIGDLSYSWYLWHWPLIVFSAATFSHVPLQASVLAAFGSLAIAVLSERYVELPVRHRPKETRWTTRGLIAVCVLSPFLVVGIASGALSYWNNDRPIDGLSLADKVDDARKEYRALSCSGGHLPSQPAPRCQWGPELGQRVVLIGDSNAGHWLPMLRELVPSMGMHLAATIHGSCPFVNLDLKDEKTDTSSCIEWSKAALEDLMSRPPAILILSSALDNYVLTSRSSFIDRDDGALYRTEEEKLRAVGQSMGDMIRQLSVLGTRVVVVEPIPKFIRPEGLKIAWSQRLPRRRERALVLRCSRLALALDPAWCQVERTLSSGEWRDIEAIRDMLAPLRFSGAHVVTVQGLYCPDGVCRSLSADLDELLYYDAGHLAPEGSFVARSVFMEALSAPMREND